MTRTFKIYSFHNFQIYNTGFIFEIHKFYQGKVYGPPTPLPLTRIFYGTWWIILILTWAFLKFWKCFSGIFMLISASSPALKIVLHIFWMLQKKKIHVFLPFPFISLNYLLFSLNFESILPAHLLRLQFHFGQCQICYFLPLLSFISLGVMCLLSKNSFLFNMALFHGN